VFQLFVTGGVAGVNDTSGTGAKFAAGVVNAGGEVHVDSQISLQIFEKI
jgi:hypothetical protein